MTIAKERCVLETTGFSAPSDLLVKQKAGDKVIISKYNSVDGSPGVLLKWKDNGDIEFQITCNTLIREY